MTQPLTVTLPERWIAPSRGAPAGRGACARASAPTQPRLRALQLLSALLALVTVALMLPSSSSAQGSSPANLLSANNPSFERAHDGWTFSHGAVSTQDWHYDQAGTSSMRVTGTVTNNDVSAYSAFVPVKPGTTYSARITAKILSSLQDGFRVRIEWANDSNVIAGVLGSAAAGAEATASVSGVAPAGATRARIRARDVGTGTWDVYLDGAMIVEAAAAPSEYYEKLPVNLLSPKNPSFERLHDGWTFTHNAVSTQDWHYDQAGKSSMHLTGTVTSNDVNAYSGWVPVEPGKFYSARITGKLESSLQAGFKARLEWANDTSVIGGVSGSAASGSEATASVTGMAPTGATRARLRAYDSGTGTWDVYLDGAMIVENGVPSHYYEELPVNMLSAKNPSFERAHDGWTFTHNAVSTQAWQYDNAGTSSMRLTGTVTNNDVNAYSGWVPVEPGKFYSARITGKLESSLQAGFKARLEWANDTSVIGGVSGSAASGSEATASVTGMAPTGATRARLRAYDSGTGTWDVYLDGAMIVEGAVPSHYYARLPVNMLSAKNPSFERAHDGWTFTHNAVSTQAWHYDDAGISSMRLTGTVTNGEVSAHTGFVPVESGKFYSARVTGKLESSLQAGFKVRLEWWSDSSQIGSSTGSPAAGSEATASVTGMAPAGATRARLRAFDEGTGTWDVYLDGAMIVEGAGPSHYYERLPANMLSTLNPSFEHGAEHWTFSHNRVASQEWHYDQAGSSSMHVTGTVSNGHVAAVSDFVPVTPGKAYSARITGRIITSLTGLRARIEWWNETQQLSSVSSAQAHGQEATASVVATAPEGATRARLRAFDEGTGTWDVYLDAAMIVEGAGPSHYYPDSSSVGIETVFELSTPATPEEVAQGAWSAGAELVMMFHTGTPSGGYVLEGEAVATAITNYRSLYGSGTPPVDEFTVKGSISTSALGGTMAAKVANRYEKDLDASEAEEPPAREPGVEYPSSLAADDAYWETQPSDPRDPEPTTASLPEYRFAPAYGKVETYTVSGAKPRVILATMRWYPGSLKHFENALRWDDTYEHNLLLYNANVPHPSRKHPFCGDQDAYFWAKRSGMYFNDSFPPDAKVYLDPDIANACKYRSFSIGVAYPLELQERYLYGFSFFLEAGGTASSSYTLYGARMLRTCHAVGARLCTVTRDTQPMIGVTRGVANADSCRRWRKGRSSRPC